MMLFNVIKINIIINSAKDATGENMRLSITLSVFLLILTPSIKSYADGSGTEKIEYKKAYSNLVTNSSAVSQILLIQDLPVESFNSPQPLEATTKVKGEFNTQLLSIEAGMLESKQESNWSKYYFQGALTLHQYDEFNVSLMANIEQLNNFNYHHNQTLFLDNSTINETKLNYSYGIITSYSISPAWQFSGGIIHAEPLNDSTQNTWNGDANMALIGTTYSF
jgi:hypothetical protein